MTANALANAESPEQFSVLVELFRRLYGGDSGLIAVSSEIKPLLGALKVSECASTVFILFD